jgi:nucleoside-diphosphate-sugar epimerase
MSTLLITGATGFLGSRILEMLEKEKIPGDLGYDTVRLLVRDPTKVKNHKNTNMRIEVIKGDLLDHESLKKAAEDVSGVIHSAALYDVRSSKKSFFSVNVEGTKALIRSCSRGTRFVLTSTYGVYGFPNRKEKINEDYEPKKPIWHYQKSKKRQEDVARVLCRERDMRFVALRPSTIIGPGDLFVIPSMIELIKRGRMMLIGVGENQLPFVHVADAARAHLLALQHIDENEGEAFHFSGFTVRFRDFLSAICSEMDVPPVKKHVPYFVAYFAGALGDVLRTVTVDTSFSRFTVAFLSSHSLLNTSKIEERLRFFPEYGLEKTVKESVDWYKTHTPRAR